MIKHVWIVNICTGRVVALMRTDFFNLTVPLLTETFPGFLRWLGFPVLVIVSQKDCRAVNCPFAHLEQQQEVEEIVWAGGAQHALARAHASDVDAASRCLLWHRMCAFRHDLDCGYIHSSEVFGLPAVCGSRSDK